MRVPGLIALIALATALVRAAPASSAERTVRLDPVPLYQIILVGKARDAARVERLFKSKILPRVATSGTVVSLTSFGNDHGYYAAEVSVRSRNIRAYTSVIDVLSASLPAGEAAELSREFKSLFYAGSLHVLRYRLDLTRPGMSQHRPAKE